MKKALIVVDMQRAFFANESLEARRSELTKACNELIDRARAHDCSVFMLRTLHQRDRSTWSLNMLDDGQGYLLDGDQDGAYVDGLIVDKTKEIIKTRDSGFWQTDLLTHLRQNAITDVVICGVSTHTCVAETSSDAYSANLRVELAIDGIGTHDPAFHESTLALLKQEYRMKTLHNDEISWKK